MKKKKHVKKTGIPVIYDDDFVFSNEGEKQSEDSFVNVFDSSLFDKDVPEFLNAIESDMLSVKKRSFVVEEELDLHGLVALEAERRVESFLLTVQKKGLRAVRIITGKGLHSDGEAVLPDLVEGMLRQKKAEGAIKTFRWEHGKKEKSGALLVELSV